MAPKSPWNKKATAHTNFQRNVVTEQLALPAINYGEVQSEEIEALQAIYMEDFQEVEVKSAWSKTTDRSFKLILRANADKESYVTLSVRLTATYPKTLPVIDVQRLEQFHDRTQRRLRNIVGKRPNQLLGEVMIGVIADEIQDALEDAVQARQQGTLPSLDDERASAEEVTTALARQAEEAEAKKLQEAQEDENRMLKQMVDEEMSRREKRKPAKTVDERPATSSGSDMIISFDQAASLKLGGEVFNFDSVTLVTTLLSRDHEQRNFLAKPHLAPPGPSILVRIERTSLFQKSRDGIMELETILQSAQNLRHANLLNILAFRIDKVHDLRYELVLCTDNADRGTIKDLLELGQMHISKARQCCIEILEALDYLHNNGVAHGNLIAGNVEMISTPSLLPKLAGFGYSTIFQPQHVLPSKWREPEGDSKSPNTRRKSDIWRFGILASQMFLGLETTSLYHSPQVMLGKLDLSDAFDDFLRKTFTVDPKKRPSAFDLLPAEFLRTEDPVMDDTPSSVASRSKAGLDLASATKRRSRHDSSSLIDPVSRYANDFTEIGRLGKGGFGEVVKARNKLDGGIYAVKKIKQAPQLLDQVISEVMLLNRLNHPYVVRYFSTWVEDSTSGSILDDSTTETEIATDTVTEEDGSEGPRMDFGYQSTGGLDFVSSAGYPQIDFNEDSDEDTDEDPLNGENDPFQNGDEAVESDDSSANGKERLRKTRSNSRKAPSVLYIQMEYCERHTLRDLIRKTMTADDTWRYVRQVTEGLAHIHGLGIIHRDLKPDNIFIDIAGSPKIGDFGLATTAQQHFVDKAATMSSRSAGDMTRSVGTTLYVAPELRSKSGTSYSDKVDMYSLGIIFYEMCEPFSTGMERINALQVVRQANHELPPAYQANGDKAAQGKLISCLISHKPSERPSSTELLRSDVLPLKIEDETIRQALSGLSDPKSPYHQKMMSALFAHDSGSMNRVKALAWDSAPTGPVEDGNRLRLRSIAKQTLENVFRRHGAEEGRRQTIFPRSGYYTNTNVVQLLDASGNLLQLPYDLTLPYARQLSRHWADVRCTFAFGDAYRDTFAGGPPRVSEEVDFDIVDGGTDDERTLNDAEILKVMDEVFCDMPLFAPSTTMSLHLNHASILNAVLDLCRIPSTQQPAVKEIVSKLGFHQHSWSKIRAELRKFGIPDTSLDDLQQFDFRDVPERAFLRLKTLFQDTNARLRNRVESAVEALDNVVRFVALLNLRRKIYITPLGSVNAKFYDDGLLFQCVLERKSNRIVIAAGGRYDGLIRTLRPPEMKTKSQGAVGVSIGLDPIISNTVKAGDSTKRRVSNKSKTQEKSTPKRCDVLVATAATEAVKLGGLKLLESLWAEGISAELAIGRTAHDTEYCFVVTLRHEASNTVKVTNIEKDGDEADVPLSFLVSHLQSELRERESNRLRQPALVRQASQQDADRKSNVQVLLASRGSKKSNKYQIVNDAQEQWTRKLEDAKSAPILAVETRDDVLDLVQQTRLSDAESWRKATQSVQLNDRQYVQQIQETLNSWRKRWSEGDGMREACVFNFRTQHCIYYDLGL